MKALFSGHSLWTRYFQIFLDIVSERDFRVLDFGFWVLDFEFFSDFNREVVQITACFRVQLIRNCAGTNIPLNTCNLYCGVDLTSQNTLANNGKMSWPRLRTDVRY